MVAPLSPSEPAQRSALKSQGSSERVPFVTYRLHSAANSYEVRLYRRSAGASIAVDLDVEAYEQTAEGLRQLKVESLTLPQISGLRSILSEGELARLYEKCWLQLRPYDEKSVAIAIHGALLGGGNKTSKAGSIASPSSKQSKLALNREVYVESKSPIKAAPSTPTVDDTEIALKQAIYIRDIEFGQGRDSEAMKAVKLVEAAIELADEMLARDGLSSLREIPTNTLCNPLQPMQVLISALTGESGQWIRGTLKSAIAAECRRLTYAVFMRQREEGLHIYEYTKERLLESLDNLIKITSSEKRPEAVLAVELKMLEGAIRLILDNQLHADRYVQALVSLAFNRDLKSLKILLTAAVKAGKFLYHSTWYPTSLLIEQMAQLIIQDAEGAAEVLKLLLEHPASRYLKGDWKLASSCVQALALIILQTKSDAIRQAAFFGKGDLPGLIHFLKHDDKLTRAVAVDACIQLQELGQGIGSAAKAALEQARGDAKKAVRIIAENSGKIQRDYNAIYQRGEKSPRYVSANSSPSLSSSSFRLSSSSTQLSHSSSLNSPSYLSDRSVGLSDSSSSLNGFSLSRSHANSSKAVAPAEEEELFDRFEKYWNLKPATPSCVQHREALRQVKERLLPKDFTLKECVLTGISGVGKTHCATTFCWSQAPQFSRIYWLCADSQERLDGDFQRLAKHLGAQGELTPQEAVEFTYKVLPRKDEKEKGWLLVFDNIESAELYEKYRPRCPGSVLITSPGGNWIKPIQLQPFSNEDAARYLESLTSQRQLARAKEVAQELDNLPSLLTEAGNYMAQTGTNYGSYLDLWKKEGARLSEQQARLNGKSATATIQLRLQRLASQVAKLNLQEAGTTDALELLRFCAFLPSEQIPLELLQAFVCDKTADQTALELKSCLLLPLRESLVSIGNNGLSLPKLVQRVLQASMSQAEKGAILRKGMDAATRAFPKPKDDAARRLRKALAPSISTLLDAATAYKLQCSEKVILLIDWAYYHYARDYFTEALSLFHEAWELAQGNAIPNTQRFRIASALSGIYTLQGMDQETEKWIQAAIELGKQCDKESVDLPRVLSQELILVSNTKDGVEFYKLYKQHKSLVDEFILPHYMSLYARINAHKRHGGFKDALTLCDHFLKELDDELEGIEKSALRPEATYLCFTLASKAEILIKLDRQNEALGCLEKFYKYDFSGFKRQYLALEFGYTIVAWNQTKDYQRAFELALKGCYNLDDLFTKDSPTRKEWLKKFLFIRSQVAHYLPTYPDQNGVRKPTQEVLPIGLQEI